MSVFAGVPSGYGNRFRSPTTASRNPPRLISSPVREAVYAARHEYCQFTGGGTYGSHPTLLGSLVIAEASRSSSLSFSTSASSTLPRRPPGSFLPFFSFRVSLPFSLSLREKNEEARRNERKMGIGEWVNENGSARLTRYWKMASTCAEGSR